VRAGRKRGFTPLSHPLPATYGCDGGRGGHQISRTPLTEPEPPHWEGKGHQGLHTCSGFLGTGDRSGPDPPPEPRLVQSEGRAQARWHLSSRNPQGGTGG